jgi:glucose-1-phosphate thymidylyltransferase
MTQSVSKQLLPVYDKPMIYYPVSTLMLAGIRDILIITTPHDKSAFQSLLGDGSQFGISFTYATQERPDGLAQALLIAEKFLAGQSSMLILGDNIFHGVGLGTNLQSLTPEGARIFTYEVSNPQDYGVVVLDPKGTAVEIEEKPMNWRSNLAVTGLYIFDKTAPDRTRLIKPSKRGELEITSLIQSYMNDYLLEVTQLSRGTAWLDTGTPTGLSDATAFIRIVEERTGLKIACLEEIAFANQWIDFNKLESQISKYLKSPYGDYLKKIAQS